MISIKIDKPIKLSGRLSIKINLNYFNQDIINIIKSYQPATWIKKEKIWELSIKDLNKILDELVYYDNISLSLEDNKSIDNNKDTDLLEDEIKEFKIKPFKHQIDAVNYGLKKERWLNLFSMGLGKSATLIYEAETLYRRNEIKHCLIICGVDSLRQQWKKTIKDFSKLDCRVLGEKITKSGRIRYSTIKERAEELKNNINEFFIIINKAAIGKDEIIDAFKKSKNNIDFIAVDEIHRIANKQSNCGSNLIKLDSKYKVGMSGSLVTNNPISCYLPLYWTDNDNSTLTNFKKQYCNFGGFNNAQVIGYKNLDLLKDELESCSIRKTFNEVRSDMPQKTIDIELLEQDEINAKFYDSIKNGVKEEADKIELNTSNLLALTTRLRQATSDASILSSNNIITTKISRTIEIVEDLVSQGEKVIVMDIFKATIKTLADNLSIYNPVIAYGDLDESLVNSNISKFKTDPNCKVLLGTNQKIGTGFDLPESHYIVMLSTPWTYSDFAQNCDRIYRLGSDENVFIKVLITKDTIDERVWEIVNKKKDLSDFLIDNKSLNLNLQQDLLNIIKNL